MIKVDNKQADLSAALLLIVAQACAPCVFGPALGPVCSSFRDLHRPRKKGHLLLCVQNVTGATKKPVGYALENNHLHIGYKLPAAAGTNRAAALATVAAFFAATVAPGLKCSQQILKATGS